MNNRPGLPVYKVDRALILYVSIRLHREFNLKSNLFNSLPGTHLLTEVSSLVRGWLRVHAIFFYLPLLSLVGNISFRW